MRTTSIRWADSTHAIVTNAATFAGTTFAGYVREATLMRAAWEAGLAAGTLAPRGTVEEKQMLLQAIREQLAHLDQGPPA